MSTTIDAHSSKSLIERMLQDQPLFHRNETEISRAFKVNESYLPMRRVARLASRDRACHGIDPAVIHYLMESVRPEFKTIETGAGLTTLLFAILGVAHISITPNTDEIEAITRYARLNDISLEGIQFVPESSDVYLPRCALDGFDLVLLDGKHAFPWPIIDWFYTADRLKVGGTMIIDDTHLRPVALLLEFLSTDDGWKLVRRFGRRTAVFQKTRQSVHDVAWHMQPWTVGLDSTWRSLMLVATGSVYDRIRSFLRRR